MALINAESCQCSKSETSIFTVPPTQSDILGSQYLEFKPQNTLSSTGPLEFTIPGQSDSYLDLSQTQLHVKAKITQADGTDLPQDAPCAPVNLFLHSMFNQVDVFLNDKMVSVPSNTYAYRAYLESLLSYGPAAKSSHLTSALYYQDTAGKMDVVDPSSADEEANLGLKKRYQFTKESKVVDMMGPLHTDQTFMDKLLLNNVEVRFKLHRSKNEFCLVSSQLPPQLAPDFRVHILDATLYVRSVKLNPALMISHARELERGITAKYPYRHVDVKSISIPQGNLSFVRESLFTGQIPRRLILGFIDNTAYSGSWIKNPYNFKHHKVNYIAIHSNGESVPWKPMQMRFSDTDTSGHIVAYQTLFQGTNILHKDQGLHINREEYGAGFTLFCFDLSADSSDGGHLNLLKTGSVRLELQFQEPLANTVQLLVYSEWDSILEIDRSRNVILNISG